MQMPKKCFLKHETFFSRKKKKEKFKVVFLAKFLKSKVVKKISNWAIFKSIVKKYCFNKCPIGFLKEFGENRSCVYLENVIYNGLICK